MQLMFLFRPKFLYSPVFALFLLLVLLGPSSRPLIAVAQLEPTVVLVTLQFDHHRLNHTLVRRVLCHAVVDHLNHSTLQDLDVGMKPSIAWNDQAGNETTTTTATPHSDEEIKTMLRQRCGLWIAGTSAWGGSNPAAQSTSRSRSSRVAGRIGQTLSMTGPPPSPPPPPSTATALLVNVSFFDRMMDLSFAHVVENCTTAIPSSNCTMPQNLLSRALGALLVEETSRSMSYWDPAWNRELRNVGIIAPIVAVAAAGLFDPMTMVGSHSSNGPHNSTSSSSSSALGDSDHHAFPAEVIAVLVVVPVIGLAVLLLVIAYVWCYKAGKCGEWCGILSRSSSSNEVVVSRPASNGPSSSSSTATAAAAAASRRSMRRGSDSKGSAASSSTMADGKNTATATTANRRSTSLGFFARLTSCCGGGSGEDATVAVVGNNNRATTASDPNEDVEIEVTAGGTSSIRGKYAVNNNRSSSNNEKRGDRQVLKWAELDEAGGDADDIERHQHRLSNSLDHSGRSPHPPAGSRHHLQQGPPGSMNASLLLHPGDSWQRERSPSSPLIRLHQTDSPPPPPTLACSVRSPNRGSRASGFFDGRADGAPHSSSSRHPSQHDLLRQPSSSAMERRSSPSFRMQSFLREGATPALTLDSHLHTSHSHHHHHHHHHYHQEGMTDGPHRLSSSGSPLTTRQGGEDDGERRGGGEGWKALSRTTMAASRLSASSPKRGGLSPAKRRALHEMTD